MASNNFIQGLYDMSASAPDATNGLSKLDEQKLRRALDDNNRIFQRNREVFQSGETKFGTCPRYDPCPICDKCRNKASHIYVACQNCKIPICAHTYKNREQMIKRQNFIIYASKETMEEIRLLDKQVTGGGQDAK